MSGLPRLAPASLTRARITAWLERHAERPLRLLAATAGAGKTTAVTMYLASRTQRHAYVALRRDESLETFRARLARALDIDYAPASFDALLAAIATRAPCEIAIDDIDRGTIETREELEALAAEAPAFVSFVYCSRSRSAIDAPQFLGRGIGAMLDFPALAFDAHEISRLAELHGVSYETGDVARLLEETEGWPIVVSWTIRDAAEVGLGLGGAYDRWRKRSGRHFREFIEDELREAGEEYRAVVRSALRSTSASGDRDRLAELEERGLFVYHADGLYRPLRVARQFDLDPSAPSPALDPAATQLLVVRMFGRFEAEIGGRRIEWIRRRDAQLFKYLLLRPSGAATRAELRAVFWPGTDQHLATQSIRTASSNIRKAIAEVTGYANVSRYFNSSGDIAVALEHAVIDARRFTAHVADGDAERDVNRRSEAFAHYRAAETIYTGDLFASDYPEAWHAAKTEMYRALYRSVLERIGEYHADAGHARQAREYEERAKSLELAIQPDTHG